MSSTRLARIDRFLQKRYVGPGKLPFMQLLVARHGQLVHHSVLGHASLEKGELAGMETVLRQEPNAIAIVSADIVAKMEISKQIAALPYRLNWSLPSVSFFTLEQLIDHPLVASLRTVIKDTARRMQPT